MNKYLRLLVDSKFRFAILSRYGFYRGVSDIKYLKKSYKMKIGKSLDLECVKTFNEKIQWLKIYNRSPLYTSMVDKYEAKKIVASKIGKAGIMFQ